MEKETIENTSFKHRYQGIADRLYDLFREHGTLMLDGFADGDYVRLAAFPHEDNQQQPVLEGINTIQMADFLANAQEDFIWLLRQLAQHKKAIESVLRVLEYVDLPETDEIIFAIEKHIGEAE